MCKSRNRSARCRIASILRRSGMLMEWKFYRVPRDEFGESLGDGEHIGSITAILCRAGSRSLSVDIPGIRITSGGTQLLEVCSESMIQIIAGDYTFDSSGTRLTVESVCDDGIIRRIIFGE